MTDLQYRILEILYKPNKEDIEYNRFILIEKLNPLKLNPLIGQDTKLNDSINANINYLNIKNELTKEYILLRKTLGKEGLGISDDNILLNFEELSKATFIDVRKKNITSPKVFQFSDVLLTEIGRQVFEKESNIKNKKVIRENDLYKAQFWSYWAGSITLLFIVISTGFNIAAYFTTTKISVEQIDKLTLEVQSLRLQSQSYKSISIDSTNQYYPKKH